MIYYIIVIKKSVKFKETKKICNRSITLYIVIFLFAFILFSSKIKIYINLILHAVSHIVNNKNYELNL